MRVLGIETSCDETAVAVVDDGTTVHSNLISSQAHLHERFGGVVPEIASRAHLENLNPMVELALERARTSVREIDAVAVTIGPGLAGALLVGIAAAKALALALRVPFIGVNHLEGHIYANAIEHGEPHAAEALVDRAQRCLRLERAVRVLAPPQRMLALPATQGPPPGVEAFGHARVAGERVRRADLDRLE